MARAVFINYRGEDSHSYGALLYRELTQQFGEERVFLDAESIPPGADFAVELLDRVRSAPVLLAVIGPRWLTATDPVAGGRRIDDPADWIHRELAEAFTAGVRVIPVLTDQAQLPGEADLPVAIAALGRCQFRHLRRREATADLARLVADLAKLDPALATAARRNKPRRRTVPHESAARGGRLRQLPADTALFTGRDQQLEQLLALVEQAQAGASPGTVVISAIDGMGGIGKTALALHATHAMTVHFPDG